jgi:hypothetical protein
MLTPMRFEVLTVVKMSIFWVVTQTNIDMLTPKWSLPLYSPVYIFIESIQNTRQNTIIPDT